MADILIDSRGVRLVVLGGEGEPSRMLGVWLKFCPSDYQPEESPPAEIAALIDGLRF